MLGMMNSPADGVEFYSTNRSLDVQNSSQISEEDRKSFSEAKEKPTISYTEDGRKLVNGKIVNIDAEHLWGKALLRGHVKTNILPATGDRSAEEPLTDEDMNEVQTDKVEIVEQPIFADGDAEEKEVPTSPEKDLSDH